MTATISKYKSVESEALYEMQSSVREACLFGGDYFCVLKKLSAEISLGKLPVIGFDVELPLDEWVKKLLCVFGSSSSETSLERDLRVSTTCEADGLVGFKSAIKIFDIGRFFQNFESPIHEWLSTVYVQSLFKKIPNSMVFRFARLKMAGLYCQNFENNLFLVFDGAPGQSMYSFCHNVATSKLAKSEYYRVVDSVAMALAQMHQFSGVKLEQKIAGHLITNSYLAASEQILRRLTGNSTGAEAGVTERFAVYFPKIEALKKRLITEDDNPDTAYLRDTAIIHGDAHAGNLFFDKLSGLVTFNGYYTALESFKAEADPLKDLGWLLASIWLKFACMGGQSKEQMYRLATQTRETLVVQYMKYKRDEPFLIQKVLQRVSFYMWNRLFYPGELTACSLEEIEQIRYFARCEFG